MDRFKERYQQNDLYGSEPSRDSSVSSYSTQSAVTKPAISEHAESPRSTASRPFSFTPSYMSAVPTRKPVQLRPVSVATGLNGHPPTQDTKHASSIQREPSPAPLPKGILLLAIASVPHPSTISYLKLMLKRGPYYRIVVIGHADREAALKQLKMDIWALLGTLGLEVNVQMKTQKSWSETEVFEATSEAVQQHDILSAVLCSPAFEDSPASDFLITEEGAFEESWRQTVGFVRSLAKATITHLRPSPTTWISSGLFIVTEPKESSSVASIHKAACDRMIALLANANTRLTIAYADSVLHPDPSPIEPSKTPVSAYAGPEDIYYGDYGATAESPTKLWNMWAMQDEMSKAY